MSLNDLLKRNLAGKKNGRNNTGGGAVIHLFWAAKRGIFLWLLNRIFVTFLFIHVVWHFKRVFREGKREKREIPGSEFLKYFTRPRPHESGRFRIPISRPFNQSGNRGVILNRCLYGEASPWGPKPLNILYTIFQPLFYTFYWQMVLLSHTLFRTLHLF